MKDEANNKKQESNKRLSIHFQPERLFRWSVKTGTNDPKGESKGIMKKSILTIVLAAGLPAFTTWAQPAEDTQEPPAATQKVDRPDKSDKTRPDFDKARPDASRDEAADAVAPRHERRGPDSENGEAVRGGDRRRDQVVRDDIERPTQRHARGRAELADREERADRSDVRGERREFRGGMGRGEEGNSDLAQGPRHERAGKGFAPRGDRDMAPARGEEGRGRDLAQRGEGKARHLLAAMLMKALDANHDGVLDEKELARALDSVKGLNADMEKEGPAHRADAGGRMDRQARADAPRHRHGRPEGEESFGAPRHQHPVENGAPAHAGRGNFHAQADSLNDPAMDDFDEVLPPVADIR